VDTRSSATTESERARPIVPAAHDLRRERSNRDPCGRGGDCWIALCCVGDDQLGTDRWRRGLLRSGRRRVSVLWRETSGMRR
jgi:hypothetical protein